MKRTFHQFRFGAVLSSLLLFGINTQGAVEQATVVDIGPHHRLWEAVRLVPDQGKLVLVTNSWTELATGLNYLAN